MTAQTEDVVYVASCPACGAEAQWSVRTGSASGGKAGINFGITCETCGAIRWHTGVGYGDCTTCGSDRIECRILQEYQQEQCCYHCRHRDDSEFAL